MKKALLALLAACSVALVPQAHAQSATAWPDKPIRLNIPFPPGGGTDILSRLVATELGQSAQWNLVPYNRPGAGGTIGIAETVKATPDGYEIVMGQKDNLIVAPWLYDSVKYDPRKDLTAIASVAYTPIIIATSVNSPFKTLDDVVQAAKKDPGSVKYGSPGNGTTIHLAAEIFSQAAGIQLMHVPYKGSNAALIDAMAGNVDLLVASVPSAMAQIKAGKLRAIAVTSSQRSTSLPDVPTVAESGYKEVDVSTWYGLFAPAGTPQTVIDKIDGEVNKLLDNPKMIKAINDQGAEVQKLSQKAFTDLVASDYEKWEGIVKASGAKVE